MNEKDIVTAAMKTCRWTQEELAIHAGYKTQSAISNRLNGKSMRVDTFVKLLSTMGYEVIVKSTSPNVNKNKWTVSAETQPLDGEELSIENDTKSKVDLDALLEEDESSEKPNLKIKLK